MAKKSEREEPVNQGLAADDPFLLWVLIAQTKDGILKARQRDYARFGISDDRRAILYIIMTNGGTATPVVIARNLFRELHSVTEMLKRMEKDGLVERRKGSGRSKIEVAITEKGREVFEQSHHNETDQRIFGALTKQERERFSQSLWKLRSRVLEDLGIPEWSLDLQNPNDGT
jgi:DNA-binding MarR family transcriptional regulator